MRHKNLIIALDQKHAFRELLSFKYSFYKGKCETFKKMIEQKSAIKKTNNKQKLYFRPLVLAAL